jgi:hypothetical protein
MPWKRLLPLLALVLAACAGQPVLTPTPGRMPTEQPPSATPAGQGAAATPSPLPPSATPLSPATAGPLLTPALEGQPGDKGLQRGNLFVEDAGVRVVPGSPAQVLLTVSGNKPTPCHEPRVQVSPPDASNTLQAQAYSVVDPNMICITVLKPFTAEFPLDPLPPGDYTLVLNDQLTIEFSV